ncbi:MAG: Rpn family recombination-promoting nuclease/putative transposase [Mariprofundales bacterium]
MPTTIAYLCDMQHDNGYKQLFSHREMVRDLLLGFVDGDWVQELDFSTLERVNGSFVSDKLRDRESDVIWRIDFKGQKLYIYLLLEFQSSVDHSMAVRMMTYVGLLYQDLIKHKKVNPQRLPPVLPLVLYNGKDRWLAKTDIADLIISMPKGLDAYKPQMRYLLLDENCYDTATLEPLDNLAAALFQMENSASLQDVRNVIQKLCVWLSDNEQQTLRRAFTVWIHRVLLRSKYPQASVQETNNLQEVESMLAENMELWAQESFNKGMQKGVEKGKQEGMQKGMQKGMQEGRQEGRTSLFLRQLRLKFGTAVNSSIIQRVEQADATELEVWSERILSANSLEDVFIGE